MFVLTFEYQINCTSWYLKYENIIFWTIFYIFGATRVKNEQNKCVSLALGEIT